MLGAMAVADEDPPVARSDPQTVALLDPNEADRDRAHHRSKAAPAFFRFGLDPDFVPAGGAPIGDRLGRRGVANVAGEQAAVQPFAAGHPERHTEPVGKPAGEAEMV